MPHDAQLAAALDAFSRRFGRPARYAAAAPGRVNLIGEHIDYCDGFVLPMAIDRRTLIVADRSPGLTIRLASEQSPDPAVFDAVPGLRPGPPAWANYVRGVVHGCLKHGLNPGGFDAFIHSTVPLGGGLSSSAALEVAAATLIETLAGQTLDPVDKALLCQRAEHEFAGVPCGIMDQFISALARPGHALLLDCRDRTFRHVPLTDPGVTVLIANTNVKHELTGGEYAQRRAQCEAALRALGVPSWRDATAAMLEARRHTMEAEVYSRGRHVIGEIERTRLAAAAMERGDWPAVGELMNASHASLRGDFEVSCAELDAMVEIARASGGPGEVFGSRMTGGGFGGCTVTLVRSAAADRVAKAMHGEYRRRTSIEPTLFTTRPAAGAAAIPLPV